MKSTFIRRFKRLTLILCCVALLLACQSAVAASQTGLTITFSATVQADKARACLKLLNQLRKQNGLSELSMPADLEKTAIQRAAELFVLFDHDRPNLTDYATAYQAYPALGKALLSGESIAAGFATASGVFDNWKGDKEHLENMLFPDFTHVGIGCVQVEGSYNGSYWVMYFQQQPPGLSLSPAKATAAAKRTMTVEIKKGMFSRVDKSHGSMALKLSGINMKQRRTAQPTVYLYDKYGVKVGRCRLEDLSFSSSNTAVFTVGASGTLTRKKAGSATLTVKGPGLDPVKVTVTTGAAAASTAASNRTAVTAATIAAARPALSATAYANHVTLSAYLKGASGYVLYRATSKNGDYRKVDEQATTRRWSLKLEKAQPAQTYYYMIRAYKNANGKRVYSEYSAAVKATH